jgi:hypothetical protein
LRNPSDDAKNARPAPLDQRARGGIPPDYLGATLLLFGDRQEEESLEHRAVTSDRNREDAECVSHRDGRFAGPQRDA